MSPLPKEANTFEYGLAGCVLPAEGQQSSDCIQYGVRPWGNCCMQAGFIENAAGLTIYLSSTLRTSMQAIC